MGRGVLEILGPSESGSYALSGSSVSPKRPLRPRAADVDLLNAVAILAVIFLHVRVFYWSPQPTPQWWIENILSGIGAAAVPIFFINSGRNLLGYVDRESTATFFKKRLSKIAVPYVFWGLIYLAFNIWYKQIAGVPFSRIIEVVFGASTEIATFWYLDAAIGVYLAMPIFAYMIRGIKVSGHDESRTVGLMLAICAFFAVVAPVIHFYFPTFLPVLGSPISGYITYALMGYWVKVSDLGRTSRISMYLLGFLGFLSFVLLGGILMLNGDHSSTIWNGYLSPGTILFAAALVICVKYEIGPHISSKMAGILQELSKLTFGIFILHIMFVDLIVRYIPIKIESSVLIATLAVWLLSALVVALLRKIPIVRKWILP